MSGSLHACYACNNVHSTVCPHPFVDQYISGSLLARYVQSVHLFFGQHVWIPSCLLCTVCPFVISGSLHAWTCCVHSVHLFVMSRSFHALYVQSDHLFVMSGSLHASYVQSVCLCLNPFMLTMYSLSICLWCLHPFSVSCSLSYTVYPFVCYVWTFLALYVQSVHRLYLDPFIKFMLAVYSTHLFVTSESLHAH